MQKVGFQDITPQAGMSLSDWWLHLRLQLRKDKRKGFDSLFASIAWQLWKERNARTFRGVALQPSMVLRLIQLEGENWIAAGAKNLGRLFCEE